MAKVYGAVTIDDKRCKGCDLCVVACPADVLQLQPKEVNDRGYHYAFTANPGACIGCAACATVCPDACIEVYRFVNRGE
ncbi:NADH-quinone oxidoreductase subunit I [Muribaculaceae bacterium]|jgi:2-oxoglutarate ferredoxin oxidoreductase subunit delta|nr:NADH-quinone oxidoreductase subunit I [Muribaculaceae bacterium]